MLATTAVKQSLHAWRWRSEIALVRAGLLVISPGDSIELSPDLHRFFADRYLRLANYHRTRGHTDHAARLAEKGCRHWIAFDPDEPPPAVAAMMPVPIPPLFTWAVAAPRDVRRSRKAA